MSYAVCLLVIPSTHVRVLVLGTVLYIASFPSAVVTHVRVLVLGPVSSHQRAVPQPFPFIPLALGIYSECLHSPIPPEV